ncbi:MAG: hypothetical protein QM673_06805 [Gordonia sp. (in: high G+C Gram-positive bacteria)]
MTTDDLLARFRDDVSRYAAGTGDLLRAVFDEDLSVEVTHREGEAKSVIWAVVPLYTGSDEPSGQQLARLEVRAWCCLDTSGRYLAIQESRYALVAEVDRTPILRYEYERVSSSKPGAHVQIHAHRGALSHLLSRTGVANPHSMESLHLPVGGDRFRPCLEDVVEFLVVECGFYCRPGWAQAVKFGRMNWRRYQLASAVRDCPSEAVNVLERLGYTVIPPEGGHAPDHHERLGRW